MTKTPIKVPRSNLIADNLGAARETNKMNQTQKTILIALLQFHELGPRAGGIPPL